MNVIQDIIKREGGYVDHPNDKGGPTKYGITLKTLAAWRGEVLTGSDDVKALTKEEATRIYREEYSLKPRFSLIENRSLRNLLIDSGVQHGPRRASKWLQRAVSVPDDGILGLVTLNAVQAIPAADIMLSVLAQRARLYANLVKKRKQRVFAAGWLERLATVIEEIA